MSDRLDALARALQRLPRVLEQQVEDTVRDNTAFLEDANTDQLASGKDATGADITPEYADLTIALKQIKGQPTDRVTLRDSGDFYTGIIAQLSGKQVELVGTDPKTAELEERYGPDIIGVPDPALDEFRQDYIKPDLQQKTRDILGV
ncbi:hypothetical protein [Hymenobacter rigui]|uniref:Uncharacterized protein n=1 Tax=Hymenobacter rigui TaxID=334424 RepID=A0A3R9P4P6_9BACT|nr:hypothetical protein [Hymenobacter rigui]RSK50103.1 hypothetical protein EI291_05480 [Hymenobacter rigui]